MSNGVPGSDRRWSIILKAYLRRNQLYGGLAEARPVARLEHELRLQIQAILPYWQQLQPGTSEEEVFAAAMVYQLTAEAHSVQQAFITSLADKAEITHALHLASRLSSSWQGTHTGIEASEWQQALTQLLQQHQSGAVMALINDEPDQQQLFALALAAQSGETSAFKRLAELEHAHVEHIFAAYWLSAQPAAYQRILAALETPHLAQHAAATWELLSGQSLTWEPTVGSISGKKQLKGPQLPNVETAQAWWQQHGNAPLPLLHGKPLVQADLDHFLSTHCGRVTEPLWWQWQYQHQQYLPGIWDDWHTTRLAVLDNHRQGR